MSTSFGSANLFGAGAASKPSADATPHPPQFGLRQRRSAAAASGAIGNTLGAGGDENAHPNRARDDLPAYGKWGSMSRVPAPPRASLATGGNAAFGGTAAAGLRPQQPQRPAEGGANVDPNRRSVAQRDGREEAEDLSLWVIGYGYRNEAHFRALYRLLERCGTITARRGGLSCFGESSASAASDDDGGNWVAVRYDSALCAQKALCQDRSFLRVGGSTMVASVMPPGGSDDVAARLGIDLRRRPSREAVALAGPRGDDRAFEVTTEEDVLLGEGRGEGAMGGGEVSGLDGLCGKVLSWFFMWETPVHT